MATHIDLAAANSATLRASSVKRPRRAANDRRHHCLQMQTQTQTQRFRSGKGGPGATLQSHSGVCAAKGDQDDQLDTTWHDLRATSCFLEGRWKHQSVRLLPPLRDQIMAPLRSLRNEPGRAIAGQRPCAEHGETDLHHPRPQRRRSVCTLQLHLALRLRLLPLSSQISPDVGSGHKLTSGAAWLLAAAASVVTSGNNNKLLVRRVQDSPLGHRQLLLTPHAS